MRSQTVFASPRTSVSQTRMTLHPASSSCAVTLRSRSTFDRSFAIQYGALCPDASRVSLVSRSRPCQKSPSQNTTTLAAVNTMSGRPASPCKASRKRSPLDQSARRRMTSHFVFALMLAPQADRRAPSDAATSPTNDGLVRGCVRVMPAGLFRHFQLHKNVHRPPRRRGARIRGLIIGRDGKYRAYRAAPESRDVVVRAFERSELVSPRVPRRHRRKQLLSKEPFDRHSKSSRDTDEHRQRRVRVVRLDSPYMRGLYVEHLGGLFDGPVSFPSKTSHPRSEPTRHLRERWRRFVVPGFRRRRGHAPRLVPRAFLDEIIYDPSEKADFGRVATDPCATWRFEPQKR